MVRGTTPKIIMELPSEIPVGSVQEALFTMAQGGKEILSKRMSDMEIESTENAFSLTLTQSETLQLSDHRVVELQLKLKGADSSVIASEILRVPVEQILSEETI